MVWLPVLSEDRIVSHHFKIWAYFDTISKRLLVLKLCYFVIVTWNGGKDE